MDFRLGLDIGIASVGWCILDESDKIINAGVRLFPEGACDENVKRRTRRASRRLLRRRQHRMERVRKLLFENNIIDCLEYDFYINEITPYHLRIKGLTEKLNKKELAIALFHLIKRRGAGDFNIENGNSDEEKSTKNILANNKRKLQDENKFVCEIQLEMLQGEKKEVRGTNNNFQTVDYVKEARQILNTQRNFYKEIDENFIEEYIHILEGRRKYFEGPGKTSPYSWLNEEEWMNGLVGNCTYFPEELRMVKNSFTAEKFNLLNDFNNLKIKREENTKLTKEEKSKLLELFKQAKTEKSVTLKKIAEVLKGKPEDITGYRIDKKDNPKFTFLKSYSDINKIYKCDDEDILDDISKIATYYQDKETRKAKLREALNGRNEVTEDIIEKLAELSYSGTHSLSKKAIKLIEDELFETNKNQMELFTEKNLVPYKMDFKDEKIKYIPKTFVDKWILSPVVKRSMIQSINVVNEILKTYGTPKEIVIELAREKNTKDKQDKINKAQKNREKENEEIRELLENKKLEKRYFELLKYWKAQGEICMYSGERISIDEIINNPLTFEIDHIIPRSISFDNSQDNKVLVKRVENQNKGQRSPFEYFSSGATKRTYEEFKKQVLDMYSNKRISMRKRDLLLLEDEITKYTRNFIARNLVDTRYTTKEFMNLLKVFFRDKNKDVKVKCINGAFTNQIRKQWDMAKMRELSHNHHAQDAYIVLMAEKIVNKLRWVKEYENNDKKVMYHISKRDVLSDKEYKELFNYEYSLPIKEYKDFKFSHFVDKKPNRQLNNETIYSTRIVKELDKKGNEVEEEYVISKISNIYDEKSNIVKFFANEKEQQKLLIYHNDFQTFEHMLKIFNEYGGATAKKNPFSLYYKEFGEIQKYSKKGNGAKIKNLKYRSSKLGNHLDITHKYKNCKNKVIMDTIPTYRADIYSNGKEYKFISVRYLMLKDRGKYFEISQQEYEAELKKKKIDESFNFKFSLFTGDILYVEKKDGSSEKLKFKGVNDDTANKIEVDKVDKEQRRYSSKMQEILRKIEENPQGEDRELEKILSFLNLEKNKILEEKFPERIRITIGKDIVKLNKIYTNVLGKEFQKENEKLEKIILK